MLLLLRLLLLLLLLGPHPRGHIRKPLSLPLLRRSRVCGGCGGELGAGAICVALPLWGEGVRAIAL